jgi:hypothetical protein
MRVVRANSGQTGAAGVELEHPRDSLGVAFGWEVRDLLEDAGCTLVPQNVPSPVYHLAEAWAEVVPFAAVA